MTTTYSPEAQDAATAHITELVDRYSRQLGGKTEGALGINIVRTADEVPLVARKLGRVFRNVASRMTPGEQPAIHVWAQRVPGHPGHTMIAGYVLRATA